MSIGDSQGRLCLIKRENCLVYTAMAALVGIAMVSILLIFKADKVIADPVYTLHTRLIVANPLPRDLDVAQLSLKLPLSFDAVVSDSAQSLQVQRSGPTQQLIYTPSTKVAVGSQYAIAMDISLSELNGVEQPISSSKLLPHNAAEIIPTPIQPLSPDDRKQLDATLLNAVKQAKTLTEYQALFSRLDPARLVSSANIKSLSNEEAVRYIYLLGLIQKSVELKQPITLFSGWVFEPEGSGHYQLWAESNSEKQKVRWPSQDNRVIYLPSGQLNVAEFISNPAPLFSPVSGFGLEVKELNMTLQKQK